MAYSIVITIEGGNMRRVMFILTALLLSGLAVSASWAYTSSLAWPQMGFPTMSAPAYNTQSMPASSLQVSTPAASPANAFGGGWTLQNLGFFKPSRASSTPVSGLPGSDIGPILELLAKLPSPGQVQQYYDQANNTTAQAPVNTFTNVSSVVPADQVIFIEVSKTVTSVDPTKVMMTAPSVLMNYKFDDKAKKLTLRKNNATDYNASQIIYGYIEDNEPLNRYIFDYGVGSLEYESFPVVFQGADGRVSIMVNGVQKDLMPGQKTESMTTEGNTRTSYTITNWGLIPRSNVAVVDKL